LKRKKRKNRASGQSVNIKDWGRESKKKIRGEKGDQFKNSHPRTKKEKKIC